MLRCRLGWSTRSRHWASSSCSRSAGSSPGCRRTGRRSERRARNSTDSRRVARPRKGSSRRTNAFHHRRSEAPLPILDASTQPLRHHHPPKRYARHTNSISGVSRGFGFAKRQWGQERRDTHRANRNVPAIVPETRQNSVSSANRSQLVGFEKWKNEKDLRGKLMMSKRGFRFWNASHASKSRGKTADLTRAAERLVAR